MSLEATYPLMEAPGEEVPPATPLSSLEQDSEEPPLSEELPDEKRRHLAATVVSVLIHAAILLLILWLATIPIPVNVKPIPVQIVNQLPPNAPPMPQSTPKPPPPKPQPKQQAQKPPPPPQGQHRNERLASDDLGNPDAPKDAKLPTETPAAGPAMPDEGSEQTHDTGASALANPDDQPTPGPLGDKSEKPKRIEEPVKKKGGSKFAMTVNKPSHAPGKYAEMAGPPASKDAYLAYLKQRLDMHRDMVGPAVTRGRHGLSILEITLLPSGHVNFVVVGRSSGFKDVDSRIVQMVYSMGDLPPVPAELLEDGSNLPGKLTLTYPY